MGKCELVFAKEFSLLGKSLTPGMAMSLPCNRRWGSAGEGAGCRRLSMAPWQLSPSQPEGLWFSSDKQESMRGHWKDLDWREKSPAGNPIRKTDRWGSEWILFQGPTVPSPPQARIRRFGTFLYNSSLEGKRRTEWASTWFSAERYHRAKWVGTTHRGHVWATHYTQNQGKPTPTLGQKPEADAGVIGPAWGWEQESFSLPIILHHPANTHYLPLQFFTSFLFFHFLSFFLLSQRKPQLVDNQ